MTKVSARTTRTDAVYDVARHVTFAYRTSGSRPDIHRYSCRRRLGISSSCWPCYKYAWSFLCSTCICNRLGGFTNKHGLGSNPCISVTSPSAWGTKEPARTLAHILATAAASQTSDDIRLHQITWIGRHKGPYYPAKQRSLSKGRGTPRRQA